MQSASDNRSCTAPLAKLNDKKVNNTYNAAITAPVVSRIIRFLMKTLHSFSFVLSEEGLELTASETRHRHYSTFFVKIPVSKKKHPAGCFFLMNPLAPHCQRIYDRYFSLHLLHSSRQHAADNTQQYLQYHPR